MLFEYDKNEIKNQLTIDQVADLLNELGAEPYIDYNKNLIISYTICHNKNPLDGSKKLYYYDNTKLFHCFTDCTDSFDIYELIIKVQKLRNNQQIELFNAVRFITRYFNFEDTLIGFNNIKDELEDWKILEKLREQKDNNKTQKIEMQFYDKTILKFFPFVLIKPWLVEGISIQTMKQKNIVFNPINNSIIIPHYDINNNLVGIRERTLIKENEKYGKYKPMILNKKLYNHPLSFNLYNLNDSKINIKKIKKAIIFEAEKSCLKMNSYFGNEQDISIACCGSSISMYQVNLLLSLGVEEIIVGFDKQFKTIGDEEWKRWTKKLEQLHYKFNKYCQISFLFDKWDLLNYKDSPVDQGLENFIKLYERRIYI